METKTNISKTTLPPTGKVAWEVIHADGMKTYHMSEDDARQVAEIEASKLADYTHIDGYLVIYSIQFATYAAALACKSRIEGAFHPAGYGTSLSIKFDADDTYWVRGRRAKSCE